MHVSSMISLSVLFLLVTTVSGAESTVKGDLQDEVLTLEEISTTPEVSEVLYDSVFLKFDPNCLVHGDLDLLQYFEQTLSSASNGSDVKKFTGVESKSLSTAGGSSNSAVPLAHLPNAKEFTSLLESHLHTAHSIIGGSSMQPKTLGNVLDSAEPRRLAEGVQHRLLGELDQEDREEELLSSLHLLAISHLVGVAKAPEVLNFEKSGKWEEAVKFIQNVTELDFSPEEFETARKQLERRHASRDAESLAVHRHGKRTFQDEHEWMGHTARPVVTDSERLHSLQLRIIHNPILQERLISLAGMLPCIAFAPEADRTKSTLSGGTFRVTKKRQLSGSKTLSVHPAPRTMQETTKARNEIREEPEYELKVPNDAFFANQWYLKGEGQGEKYGAHVVDGWSTLLRNKFDADNNTSSTNNKISLDFSDLSRIPYGMDIAVLDSGCSRNPDLINQFWFNEDEAGCVAAAGQADFLGDDTDSLRGDCVGYDFGNDSPDPTKEEGKIHGSSTSGLIAAEGNNNIGITGICPHCRVMCLKIYDAETKKITLTSVTRALNYVAEKKIKLSNHSYGGFGASNVEYAAHEALNKLGHLTVASSGNNGCNIDLDPEGDPNACVNESGDSLGLFTPAGYDLPNILSVGGVTDSGELAWFSNYGKDLVDVFAPGNDIITIYGTSQMASVKGTSFSSPIVTGIAGVLWSYKPELTAHEVKELLMSSAQKVDSLKDKARSPGVVSLSRALGADKMMTSIVEESKATTGREILEAAVRRLTASLLLPFFMVMGGALI